MVVRELDIPLLHVASGLSTFVEIQQQLVRFCFSATR
jgi:hypothetical protein